MVVSWADSQNNTLFLKNVTYVEKLGELFFGSLHNSYVISCNPQRVKKSHLENNVSSVVEGSAFTQKTRGNDFWRRYIKYM